MKIKMKKIFTKLRSEINNKEDCLLLELEKLDDNEYIKEEINKES